MKKSVQRTLETRFLIGWILAAWVLSFFLWAYWWFESNQSHLNHVRQRAAHLQYLEEVLSDSRITFAHQIQEWKDLLLRGTDPRAFEHYLEGFETQHNQAQMLLDQAGHLALQEKLGNSQDLLHLADEHRALYPIYKRALSYYNSNNPLSYAKVDALVHGLDRHLQGRLAINADLITHYVSSETRNLGLTESLVVTFDQPYRIALITLQLLVVAAFLRLYWLMEQEDKAGKRASVIMESIGDCVIVTDEKGHVEFVNHPAMHLLGQSHDQLQGKPFKTVFPIFNATTGLPAVDPVERVLKEKRVVELENHTLLRHRDGHDTPIEDSAAPMFGSGQQLTGVVLVFHDMTRRYQLLQQLREERELFQSLFNQSSIGIAYCSFPEEKIQICNAALGQMIGVSSPERLQGRKLVEFMVHPYTRTAPSLPDFGPGASLLHANSSREVLVLNGLGQQHWYHQTDTLIVSEEKPPTLVSLWIDIHERKQAQNKLEYFAYYDALTGLANRTLLKDRVDQAIALALRKSWSFALLLIDLDNFKSINDTQGHPVGDRLLQAISFRLKGIIRNEDTIARFGGDEFVILLNDITTPEVESLAKKLCTTLMQCISVDDNELFITPSVGISVFPSHGNDFDSLLRRADMAMYHVKSSGKASYRLFSTPMEDQRSEEYVLEMDLRHALKEGEFELYFQPKVSLSGRRIRSAEALIRWNHPQRGQILPNDFIPLAERSELIDLIGEWVIHQTCRFLHQCRRRGFNQLQLSFNASPRQLMRGPLLIEHLHRALEIFEIPAHALIMEITETALMNDASVHTARLISEMGVRISLDDFGTGYSSLSLLQKLPFSALKIDRSFVSGFRDNPTDNTLVKAVISIGLDLSLEIVAEGIEQEEQARVLESYGCHLGQGYLFGRPMPVSEFLLLLAQETL
ncbi:MAG: EAL domain-containing protein [Ferrovum sp.]|nr:EAL domain-containing protein [Ferrovum sp.]